jgi:hypothetical protein
MVSAAAVTKRITRLEELGLVERLPDPADGRARSSAGLRMGGSRNLLSVSSLGEA